MSRIDAGAHLWKIKAIKKVNINLYRANSQQKIWHFSYRAGQNLEGRHLKQNRTQGG